MNYKQLQKFLYGDDNPELDYSEYDRFMIKGGRYINVRAYVMPKDMLKVQNHAESLRVAACQDDSKADEYVEYLLSLYFANTRKSIITIINGKPEVIYLSNTAITRGAITSTIYEKLEEAFKEYITYREFLFSDLIPSDDSIATIQGIKVINPINHFVLCGG